MGIPRNATLAETIYRDIEKNEYLNQLYADLLYNYSLKLFSLRLKKKEIDINAALRFADILSKSAYTENASAHKIWAQEIIILLHILYPEDDRVTTFLGSVLSAVGNYRGLDSAVKDYESADVLDQLYYAFDKERLAIPGSDDKYFFPAQKIVYDALGKKCFSYSGPTSMGKSFVIQTYITQQITAGVQQNFAILVPTKALINEVRSNLCKELNHMLDATNYRVVVSAGDIALKYEHNYVFVMTPERMLHLINTRPDLNIDFMFVDEAHKISTKGPRSTFYYKVINKVMGRKPRPSIVFASPNIPNPEIYLNLIPGVRNINVENLASKFAPVCQFKYLVNMTTGKIFSHNEHSRSLNEIKQNQTEWKLVDLVRIVGKDKQNIVYCNSRIKVIDSAWEYAKSLPVSKDPRLLSLAKDIAAEVHSDCFLSKLIEKGVAYHVGYLPASIRLRIEKSFEDGLIRTIFCTSTLVEGVNLPADNLFVTSHKNGLSAMDEVEFRNLIGRVGRIKYNLYGNVFLLIYPSKSTDVQKKYENLLNNDVPAQSLSVAGRLTVAQRKAVITHLARGDIQMQECIENETDEDYNAMRKFALIVAHDVVTGQDTPTLEAFSEWLTPDNIRGICTHFWGNRTSDDITLSYDQWENLETAIEKGLEYPALQGNDAVDFKALVDFLCKLRSIFKWDVYERNTIGKKNQSDQYRPILEWYATILMQWIRGNGLSVIIRSALWHKKQHPDKGVWNGRHKIADYYIDSSMSHRNYVMAETLDVIENVILFSLSNYFRKFSLEYKRIHGVEHFPNDWYEFVEYGSTNPLTILLQQHGYSRESSQYIMSHPKYLVAIDGQYRIKTSIMECNDIGTVNETKDIIFNSPDLFIEDWMT